MRCRCSDNPWPGMIEVHGYTDGRVVYEPCRECNGSCVVSCCDTAGSWQVRPGPGFWIYETTGALRPAIETYLKGESMSEPHIAAMRAYLRQWIAGPWASERLEELRARINQLTTHAAIKAWLDDAMEEGIDPL